MKQFTSPIAGLIMVVASSTATAAAVSTMDEFGNLTCHNCLFDLITGQVNVFEDYFVKPQPDLYRFNHSYLFTSTTTITPDPMLPANPWPAPPRPPAAVPNPTAALLFGSALLAMGIGTRRR